MICTELAAGIRGDWESWPDYTRSFVLYCMVDKKCTDAVPYLLQASQFQDPLHRRSALVALGKLGRRDVRRLFNDKVAPVVG
jgi:hypothetical protein